MRESISREKDLFPYWNERCREISLTLLLPTKTVWKNSAVPPVGRLIGKPWFSIEQRTPQNQNSQRICSPSFISSLADCTGLEITKTKLLRIYPTSSQKEIFKQWIGVSRKVYNQTIETLREKDGPFPNPYSLKPLVLSKLEPYCDKVPYQIKGMAVADGCKSVVAAISKYKKSGVISNLRFRSRKDPIQSLYIPKSAVKELGIYSRISGKGLKFAEKLPESIMDSRLVLKYGRWFLAVPQRVKTMFPENQGKIVALDPGIRKFLTFYSEASIGFIGRGAATYLFKKLKEMDELRSRIATGVGKKKYRLKKAFKTASYRVQNLISELHWKTINFLLKTYDAIILPTFSAKDLSCKAGRKLGNKSVRQMLTLSHYKFAQRLEFKCKELGKTLIRCSEAYTSKTVSWTGNLISNLGSKETISFGGVEMDRDLNGARGIFLRALVDHPSKFDINLPAFVRK